MLVHDGQTKVKRLQHIGGGVLRVISDNANYENYDVKMDGTDIRIVGRVLRALPLSFIRFA